MNLKQDGYTSLIKQDTAEFYHRILLSDNKAQEYLKSRGISLDTAKKMMLGYALGNETLLKHFIDNDIDPLAGVDANVLKVDKFNNIRDYFNNYVIFPIIEYGIVESMSARSITDVKLKHVHLKGAAKKVFNGDVIRSSNRIFMVESPFNALSLIQCGYDAIAILGANSFKNSMAKQFENKEVYIVFDNDTNKSGQKAALRTANILYDKAKVDAHIVTMPLDVDVNDYFLTHNEVEFARNILAHNYRYTKTKHYRDYLKSKERKKNKKPVYDEGSVNNVNSIPIIEVVRLFEENIEQFGDFYKCICPLPNHIEAEGSFTIYPTTNTVKCYGCGFYGDNIDLVREITGLNFGDAIKFLKNNFRRT